MHKPAHEHAVSTARSDPAYDYARSGPQPGPDAEEPEIESDEDFRARIAVMSNEERKQAIDDRNLQLRGPEAKAGVDPDPIRWTEPDVKKLGEHPVYGIERDLRTLEMVISRTASRADSDVLKALDAIKRNVHGIIDNLPGTVNPSKPQLIG